MTPKTIEWHPEAIAEARAARRWYAARNPRAARAFIEELDRAEDAIRESPSSWPWIEGNVRRYLLRRLAWLGGEVRATHQPLPKSPRNWRTREDPFAAVWPRVREWLEAEPDRTARELLLRLQRDERTQFPDGQLRTLQRRVKEWRRTAVERLIFPGPDLQGALPAAATAVSMLPAHETNR